MQKEESTKYQLLELLKMEDLPGPFASDEEVRTYMSQEHTEETKVKRLYNEVRYARMSSVSLKPTAAVFRLKQNYKNLSSEEYADNLISYLSTARSCKTITIDDLNNVMHGIEGKHKNNNIPAAVHSKSTPHEEGEHVVAFWYDASSVKWYLGVVDGFNNDNVMISYMNKADASGTSWTFPERAEVLETSPDQILASKVQVQYKGTVRIRCSIVDKDLITEMNLAVKQK